MSWLAQLLLAGEDWSRLRTLVVDGGRVPRGVAGLAAARTAEEADAAYWLLDNFVIVQGELFEAALPLVPVVLALLAGELSLPARAAALELLFQIAVGELDDTERRIGNTQLQADCRAEVCKGQWLFSRGLLSDDARVRRVALELVFECGQDCSRIAHSANLPPVATARRRVTAVCLPRRRFAVALRRLAAAGAGSLSLCDSLSPAAPVRRLSTTVCRYWS
jgi:hypothetical protein